MNVIESIATLEGRSLLRQIYETLRYEYNRNSITILFITWRIATIEKETAPLVQDYDYHIKNTLGIFRGTGVWLQEIVNRYYSPQVNALVYFGAALLLIIIGLNRFIGIPSSFVIAGIVIEASLLFLLFIVLLFTPVEIPNMTPAGEQLPTTDQLLQDLIRDIGEISSDYAKLVQKLDEITTNLSSIAYYHQQNQQTLEDLTRSLQNFLPHSPEFLESLQKTTEALGDLRLEIARLKESTEQLQIENVRNLVRKELEDILLNRVKTKTDDISRE